MSWTANNIAHRLTWIFARSLHPDAAFKNDQLKTYSLNTLTGIFISYSSGRLPFGLENESAVELGFKTYF